MAKRTKLDIIKDILGIIRNNQNSIKITPLLRKSNISSKRFYAYINELSTKDFIEKKDNFIVLKEKGFQYLKKYETIISFIEEFDL